MRRPLLLLSALLTVVALLTGCAAKRAENVASSEMTAQEAAQPAPADRGVFGGAEMPAAAPEADYASGEAATESLTERMIIRTVDMSIVVADTDEALSSIRQMVAEFDGYIADSNRWLVGEQPRAQVTLRIPADKLDLALDSLRSSAIRVERENMTGQDVTEEYYDLDARLRNLEATEQELLALLTEVRENRGKAEDILAVYREITEIRGQIESLKGRQTYLSQMSSLATVTVEIVPKDQPVTVVEKDKWNPLVTASGALRSFVQVFQTLIDVLIYVLILSPIVLIPALVLWLIIRAIRRRQAKRGKTTPSRGAEVTGGTENTKQE